jgi:hypothetical protein
MLYHIEVVNKSSRNNKVTHTFCQENLRVKAGVWNVSVKRLLFEAKLKTCRLLGSMNQLCTDGFTKVVSKNNHQILSDAAIEVFPFNFNDLPDLDPQNLAQEEVSYTFNNLLESTQSMTQSFTTDNPTWNFSLYNLDNQKQITGDFRLVIVLNFSRIAS